MEHAYNKWRNEIWDSCKALWCLWVPGQLLNFAVVPRYLRVPFGRFLTLFCPLQQLSSLSSHAACSAQQVMHASASDIQLDSISDLYLKVPST